MGHTGRAHAKLSPSGAHRWLNCTPSPSREAMVKGKYSPYAAEGTLAHEFAELELKLHTGGIAKKEYQKQFRALKSNELYYKGMLPEVEKYVNYILHLRDQLAKDGNVFIELESRVYFSDTVPGGHGVVDTLLVSGNTLYVIDLKFGRGVKVEAEGNPQLRLYGLGALNLYRLTHDIENIELIVHQPRLNNVSIDEMTVEYLTDWAASIAPIAVKAQNGEGEAKAGDWCRFCKVKATCKAAADHALDIAKLEFQDDGFTDTPDLTLLTDAEILSVYRGQDFVKGWLKSVEDHVLDEALKGKEWKGLKVVESKTRRKWEHPDDAADKLQSMGFGEKDIYNKKLKSITDVANLISVDQFTETLKPFVGKTKGKPVLVDEDDPRPVFDKLLEAKREFK